MSTTQQDISIWFDHGKQQKASHMLIVCDTFDYEDYPVYVNPDEDILDKVKHYSGNMQKVMEVYNLTKDKQTQLNQTRSFNY